jgi:hypothetical protein
MDKLRQAVNSNTTTLKIDEPTLYKLEQLFVEGKTLSNVEVFKEAHKQENLIDEKIVASYTEYKDENYIPRDTFKDLPLDPTEY